MKSLSIPKLVGFIFFCIGVFIVYYKKGIPGGEGRNKKLILLKHICILFVLMGILSILSILDDDTEKAFVGIIVVIVMNLYNINHSIKKCKLPTLYEFNLYGRSSIIMLFVALLLYYSYKGNFFRFLYSERELDTGESKYTVDELKDTLGQTVKIPVYCPDMDQKGYETSKDWTDLSSEEKNTCSAAHSEFWEREDISSKIYA